MTKKRVRKLKTPISVGNSTTDSEPEKGAWYSRLIAREPMLTAVLKGER